MLSKKGAMFGLDARIALAIFGALSLISGAALYSAIQKSKVTAIISESEEIEKALSAYYIDTGEYPKHAALNPTRDFDASYLKENPTGVIGWNGPYFTDKDSSSKFIVTAIIPNSTLTYRKSDSWSDYNTDSNCTKAGDDCAVFLWVGITDSSIQKSLEKKIDGRDLLTAIDYTGSLRVHTNGVFIKTDLYYPNNLAPI